MFDTKKEKVSSDEEETEESDVEEEMDKGDNEEEQEQKVKIVACKVYTCAFVLAWNKNGGNFSPLQFAM